VIPIAELARRRAFIVVDENVGRGTSRNERLAPRIGVDVAFTVVTVPPLARISAAASASGPSLRPLIHTATPSRAKAVAHALPSPLEEAQTIAFRPFNPRSI
jgi:hypothetical protein